jgi:glycosyltransferase involved in cell wall biosynthesis
MANEADPLVVIATILNEEGPTGVQTHFQTFRGYLNERARESILVTPFSAAKWMVYPIFAVRRFLDPLSGAASVWWYRHWHAVFLKFALKKVVARTPDCIIYAQCPLSALAALEARQSALQRVVMVVHYNSSQADEWKDKGKISADGKIACGIRRLESTTLPQLDGIVYVSNFMKAELERRTPRLARLSNAVIPNFCQPLSGTAHDAESLDIINVGTLEPRKNQRFLLEVVAYAKRQGKCYMLGLIGDGPDRSKLWRLARTLDIERQVKLLGNRPNAIQLMGRARLYAHSAFLENLPLALIEAMSCGLPILAPAVGGIPDLFEEGEAGYFWKLDDIPAAGELLIRTLDSARELKRMGAAGKERFRLKFDSRLVARRLHEFILGCREPAHAAPLPDAHVPVAER